MFHCLLLKNLQAVKIQKVLKCLSTKNRSHGHSISWRQSKVTLTFVGMVSLTATIPKVFRCVKKNKDKLESGQDGNAADC